MLKLKNDHISNIPLKVFLKYQSESLGLENPYIPTFQSSQNSTLSGMNFNLFETVILRESRVL